MKYLLGLCILCLTASACADVGYTYKNESYNSTKEFPVASTAKVITAVEAINTLNEQDTITNIYYSKEHGWAIDSQGWFLDGEDLDKIVALMKADKEWDKSVKIVYLNNIIGNAGVTISGETGRAYNAVYSPVMVNFGTTTCKKVDGTWVTNESHSPLTYQMNMAIQERGCVKGRMNVGESPEQTAQAAMELWELKLGKDVIVRVAPLDVGSKPYITYTPKTSSLKDTVTDMLLYSTNVIATGLVVKSAYKATHKETTKASLEEYLTKYVQYGKFVDGSGLNVDNVTTPETMLAFLNDNKHIKPYMKRDGKYGGCHVKTGTLPSIGVYAVVGYDIKDNPFVIFTKDENAPRRSSIFNNLNVDC